MLDKTITSHKNVPAVFKTVGLTPSFLFVVIAALVISIVLPQIAKSAIESTRGINVTYQDPAGNEDQVKLYQGSYALLVGVSKYSAGWPVLESVPSEIDKVAALLTERGFQVEKLLDPDGEQLARGFREFINQYGLDQENRLLFFYSGHGYTRQNGKKGYLVPTDAPDPNIDLTGFLKKSLGMNQVLAWARYIEAKHALFLFDSCFSGSIFKQKSRPSPPPHITRLTIEPVRQFITAGGAGEEVPAQSTFTPAFIDAIRYGLADFNKDGYISATELGLYLQTKVPQHANQNPQYGKIRDYDLSRGDFIFMANSSEVKALLQVESNPAGTSVYIDDVYQGTTPLTLDNVISGSHVLRAEKKGYVQESRNLEVPAGRHVSVHFDMVPSISHGSLTVTTTPADAKVTIPGHPDEYTPGMRLGEGGYRVQVAKAGYVTETYDVHLHANEDLHLDITLKPERSESFNATTTPIIQTEAAEPVDEIGPPSIDIATTPPTISPTNQKVVHEEHRSIPKNIASYISKIRSQPAPQKRNTAKIIYRKNILHPALLEAIEEELVKGASRNLNDRYHVDAMAWFCNILGKSKNRQYRQTLKKVADSNTNRKIRKYAIKNMELLR